jgi:hypothetical protein
MYWLVEKCIQSVSQKIWKEGHRLDKYSVDVDCIRIAKDVLESGCCEHSIPPGSVKGAVLIDQGS